MPWLQLLVAGLFECGWPVGLKLGWTDHGFVPIWLLLGAVCIAGSGTLLFFAQRRIPMGTAYAVWTGIGAAGTFLLGIALFDEPPSAGRFVCVGVIVTGIVGLKVASR